MDDINLLVNKPRIEKEIHVVFGGVIDVALLESVPFARSSILWQNFYRMVTLKRAYDMSVKMKDNVLVAGVRRSVGDTEKLIDLTQAMFK